MRTSKRYKIGLFLLTVFLVNTILSFLIEPARGASDNMWKGYYSEEDIEMLFLGSSLSSASFDPAVFERELGVNAFNMGTPMQSIASNKRALQVAVEEHDIQTVIIGIGFFVLQEEPFRDAEMTFEKELARHTGGLKGWKRSLEYVLSDNMRESEKSINYWFPWIYNKEDYLLDTIKRNVVSKWGLMIERLHGKEEEAFKGYQSANGLVDENDGNSYEWYNQSFLETNIKDLEELLELCNQYELDALVINTPHPEFDVKSCETVYAEHDVILRSLCNKYNVEYYDFSLAKETIFQDDISFYHDFEHLNYKGSQVFSEVVCNFLKMRENGQDLDVYFYSVAEYFEKM